MEWLKPLLSSGCFCLIFLTGCPILNDYDAVLLLWPDKKSLPVKPDYWEIRWLEQEGVRSRRVAQSSTVVLKVLRELPLVVSARAVTNRHKLWRYKPAGLSLALDERKTRRVALKWEEGFAAEILLNMASQGISPEKINIKRFRDAIRERGENNPWNIDMFRLGNDIAAGKLWIYSFRLHPMVKTVLPLPPGDWIGEYPLENHYEAGADGWTGILSEGLHRFLRLSDTKDAVSMSVMIDKNGRVTAVEESN